MRTLVLIAILAAGCRAPCPIAPDYLTPAYEVSVLSGRARIGMTAEEVRWALDLYGPGDPRSPKVNRVVLPTGNREQWVLGRGAYLYFEDGILVAFQERKW